MFDISWLSWLGIGGVGTAALVGAAAYFLGAKAVVEALAPLLKGLSEGIVAVVKLLWSGTKQLFETVSDLVMVALIVGATWFVTTAHHKLEVMDLKFTHAQEIAKLKKQTVPVKPKTEGNGQFPFDFFR